MFAANFSFLKLKYEYWRQYTDTERTLICLMFYFSQPRNQTQPLKKKKRKAERTRYNLKLFYKVCPIFDNKE